MTMRSSEPNKALTDLARSDAPTARMWGTGIALLDYRQVGEGTYEATRWLTVLFVPLIAGPTWVIRPVRSMVMPGLFGVLRQFEKIAEKPTPTARILRTYAWGGALAVLAFGPLVVLEVLSLSNRLSTRYETPLFLTALVVPFTILWNLNAREERVYEDVE